MRTDKPSLQERIKRYELLQCSSSWVVKDKADREAPVTKALTAKMDFPSN